MPQVEPAISPGAWALSDSGISAATEHPLQITGATVVSSPERKAVQTTALMSGRDEDAVGVDPRFREVDRVERVHHGFRVARAAWIAGRLDERHEGWETPDAAARRFHDGLLAHSAGHLVVGTHGMVLVAWMIARGLIAPGDEAVTFWEGLRFPDVIALKSVLLVPDH